VTCPLQTKPDLELGFQPTEGGGLARKRYTAEEIIGQLRTIEIELGKGLAVSRPVGSWGSRNRPTIDGRKNMAGYGSIKPNG